MTFKKILLGILMCGTATLSLVSCKNKNIDPVPAVVNVDDNNDDNENKPEFNTFNVVIRYFDQEVKHQKITSDTTISLDIFRPNVDGYVFEGWYTDASYSKSMNSTVSYTSDTIIAYAKYKSVHYDKIEDILKSSKFDKTKDFYSHFLENDYLEYDCNSQTAKGKFLEYFIPAKQGYRIIEYFWEKDVLAIKYESDTRGTVEYISLPIDTMVKVYNERNIDAYDFLKNKKFEYSRHNSGLDYKIFYRTDTMVYSFEKRDNYTCIYNVVTETNKIFSLGTFLDANIERLTCTIEGYSYNPK